jgi:hypothetical protein
MFRAECMIQRVVWALHRMALGADLHWRPLTGDKCRALMLNSKPLQKAGLMLGLRIFLLFIQCFNSNQHVWIASTIKIFTNERYQRPLFLTSWNLTSMLKE